MRGISHGCHRRLRVGRDYVGVSVFATMIWFLVLLLASAVAGALRFWIMPGEAAWLDPVFIVAVSALVVAGLSLLTTWARRESIYGQGNEEGHRTGRRSGRRAEGHRAEDDL